MKVYIDTNVFIYAATDEGKIGDAARKILADIQRGKYEAYTAMVTLTEAMHVVGRMLGRTDAQFVADNILKLPHLTIIICDQPIMKTAMHHYIKDKLLVHDAIHLASMLSRNITTIISQDKDFDKVTLVKRKAIM